ncbi:MAG: hypothetical protein JWM14_3386 [Chitinophagaceae bacterium]|nr:hypothetical protein [Chitinophagaceae bacterium]
MDFIYITLGLNILLIFLVKREWLLERQPFTIIMFGNAALFVLGYALPHFSIVFSILVEALKIPILSQLLFMFLVKVFRKINKTPVDTFWTMDTHLMKDIKFNLAFWIIAILLPAIIVYTELI